MNPENQDVDRLLLRIAALTQELAASKNENQRLREGIEFLKVHPTIAGGVKGEELVSKLIDRDRTTNNAGCDFDGDIRIEVKYSRLIRGNFGALRWQWMKVFGSGGKKKYHRLILIGDTDPKHAAKYLNPSCPFVFFDVPYEEVSNLTSDGGPGKRMIHLSTNPSKHVRSRADALYTDYQVTAEIIEAKYRASGPLL